MSNTENSNLTQSSSVLCEKEHPTAMNFVPSQLLPHLICANCNNYLSHFPIHFHSQKGSLCGRCTTFNMTKTLNKIYECIIDEPLIGIDECIPLNESNTVRNEIYECIAQTLKFPCCYHSNGCTENLIPNRIPQHEKYCPHKTYDCPTACFTDCKWHGDTRDLVDHFEQKHPTLFLKDGKFELDFINTYMENCLLTFAEEFFVVNRSSDSKSLTFSCIVSYLGTNPLSKDYVYKIILENERKSHAHVITNKLDERTDIKIEGVRDVLSNPSSIVATIEVFECEGAIEVINDAEPEVQELLDGEKLNGRNSNVDYDLLKELKCLICLEYMLPPIYQCLIGHSICGVCKNKVKQCPTCRNDIGDTQNFTLAEVINYIMYPCKNERCNFTTKAKDIRQHEATCIFGLQSCPLKEYEDCHVELIFSETYDHILKNHCKNLLETETVNIPFDFNEHQDQGACYVIQYGFRLFRMHFRYSNGKFSWTVQLIGPRQDSVKYMFEIDVLDNSGKNRRAYFKSRCTPLTFIYINYEQIKSMIKKNFTYRVRILQE